MLETKLREEYTWVAFYSDFTELSQVNPDHSKNSYDDIDRSKLAAFGIKRHGKLIYRVFLEPDQTLIYRRRPAGNENEQGEIIVQKELILIGTKQKIKGVDVQHIAYIEVGEDLIQHAGKWVGGQPTLRSDEIDQ
jgi:hypothetical protein